MSTTRDIAPSRERRLVETFVELADTLVEDFDVIEFCSALTERVVELGLASEAGILLAAEDGELQFVAASAERTRLLELFQAQIGEGPCYDCFTTGGPVRADDLEDESDRWPVFAPRAVSAGFCSVQAVPLRHSGSPVTSSAGPLRPATCSERFVRSGAELAARVLIGPSGVASETATSRQEWPW